MDVQYMYMYSMYMYGIYMCTMHVCVNVCIHCMYKSVGEKVTGNVSTHMYMYCSLACM